MENLDNANEVLTQQQNALNAFDTSVDKCRKKFEEVEKFVSKKFDTPTNKHSSLMQDVLVLYSSCAVDNNIQVAAGVAIQNLTEKLAKAPKKSDKVAYLPGKLLQQLSSIIDIYSEAFGTFRDGLDMQAQQALVNRDALVRHIPLHRRT